MQSFTSVVGPNGSGKSNVIDALLFVLGYRAKKMRQTKLADLIHNSENYPNLDSCSVLIYFNEIIDLNETEYRIVPNTEIVVSRTAHKNNKNAYFVNGVESSFTQVTDLLRNKGIDLDHKRFLILQGEVESIALMKPKGSNEHEEGLLEYLEDIIGTSKYVKDISETEEKYEQTSNEYGEQLSRFKIMEKELSSLGAKKEEAEKFLQKEKQLIETKNVFYQKSMFALKNKMTAAETEITALEERLEKVSSNKVFEDIKLMETQLSQESRELEELKAKIGESAKESARFERDEISVEEKKKHLKKKMKALAKGLEERNNAIKQQERNAELNSNEIAMKRQELSALEKQFESAEKEYLKIMDSLKGKTSSIQAEIEKKEKELKPTNAKKIAVKTEVDKLKSRILILEESVSKIQNEETDSTLLREKSLVALKEEEKKLASYSKDHSGLGKVLSNKQQQLQLATAREQDMKQELDKEIQGLEEQKALQQSQKLEGTLLSNLMKEAKSGRIKGIFGRLGDLGTIDAQYDVAISTACGGLDHIVVDTTSTAQKCVEFLKRHNLGRSTFIIMDKIGNSESKIQVPGGARRIVDLITLKDPSFRAAFYYSLRDTLVCETLEEANKIAFGQLRYRVVTLDGKLIDKSGTMSGGGNRVAKGGMRVSFVTDVEKLEREVKKKTAVYEELVQAISVLEDEIRQIQGHISEISTLMTKCQMSVESLRNLIAAAPEATPSAANGQVKEEAQQIKELRKALDAKQAELEKLSDTLLEREIKQLQNTILESGGIKLQAQKSKMDGIKEQIEICTKRIAKLEVENETKAMTSNEFTAREEEFGELEKQLAKLEEETATKTKIAKKVEAKCEESKRIFEDKKDTISEIKRKLEERRKETSKLKAQEIDLRAKIQEDQKVVKESKATMMQLLNELEALRSGTDSIPKYTKEELDDMDVNLDKYELANSKPNLSVLDEYAKKAEIAHIQQAKTEMLEKEREETKSRVDLLKKQRFDEFMSGFNKISMKLKEMYQLITLGGNAELELVDSLDPFSEGIIFSVMPPKKSWKNIANLSGGEKTLSSLALVFALHDFKPTPIYVMDEIDAALDFRNVSIVANYIKERTKNAQFIIISLRNNMFELADMLVGIYKTNNCTKSVTIQPSIFSQFLALPLK